MEYLKRKSRRHILLMIHTTHVPDLVTAEWMSKTQLLAGCARTDGSWLITPSPLYNTLPLTSTPLVVRCDLQAGGGGTNRETAPFPGNHLTRKCALQNETDGGHFYRIHTMRWGRDIYSLKIFFSQWELKMICTKKTSIQSIRGHCIPSFKAQSSDGPVLICQHGKKNILVHTFPSLSFSRAKIFLKLQLT